MFVIPAFRRAIRQREQGIPHAHTRVAPCVQCPIRAALLMQLASAWAAGHPLKSDLKARADSGQIQMPSWHSIEPVGGPLYPVAMILSSRSNTAPTCLDTHLLRLATSTANRMWCRYDVGHSFVCTSIAEMSAFLPRLSAAAKI